MNDQVINKIKLMMGDITQLDVDAIVNAANKTLLGGGGVDGAIHRAAGPKLLEECSSLGGCQTGEAEITKGYNLKAKHVIHTVGPIYRGKPDDSRLLSDCYFNSLMLAERNNIKTIAFPAISCGAYGFPIKEASRIAIDTTINFLKENSGIQKVIFIVFSASDFEVYQAFLNTLNA